MPLVLPSADERSFASLVADARSRIPRLAPGWTDHNAHDPGITLIELLAHLTEADLYRLGRVTAAQRRSFLRWFGLESGGPTVAETVVALGLTPPSGPGVEPVRVEADREIAATGDVVFSTTAAVTVQAAGITGLLAGERRIFDTNAGVLAAVLDTPIAALGPRGDDALTITLDRQVAGDITLYLWTGAEDHDDGVRRRLKDEATAVSRDRVTGGACSPARVDDWRRHHDVDLVWEIGVGGGAGASSGTMVWLPVSEVEDRTRGLTLSGFVRLGVYGAAGAAAAGPATFDLRVRRLRGQYEAPPLVRAVLLNAVPARHQTRAFSIRLGSSTGLAGQVFRVPRGSTVPAPGTPLVFDRTGVTVVPAAGAATTWTVATDWDRAGAAATTVVLDAEAAELRFGDGHTGSVPPAGAFIDLISRVGGGAGGNVPARTLSRVARGPGLGAVALDVLQPFAARGGGSAPTVGDLQARLLSDLARPTRAATLADFERLAREAPGVHVGRVRAMADHHPVFPDMPALGCVTVVVVPQGPGSRLEPTAGLLAVVGAYLGRRRPVTTELHVIGPTYINVAVRARLHLSPQAVATTVQTLAARRLDEFFHPLTGGAEGSGWPVGRDVYRSEILALLQDVPGVHHVDELSLLVGPERAALCENVTVCPTDLIAAMPHEMTIAPREDQMSEKPIERLNYFNGQRLEADDLRLEQEYHVRIQRLLMKSLFTPGVAEGFEVSPVEGGKKVAVRPGVALDDLGRAIVLVNSVELQPQSRYLCVRYAEQKAGVQGGECKVNVNGPGKEQLARWGGPGRITSEPDFFWRRDPPLADERELLIAELILKADCTVDKVEYEARKQAVPAPLASVRPVSLEGEKDIDKNNSKVIRFHVAHARATKVTLHLQARKFSTLHYTEIPSHNHSSKDDTVAIGPRTVPYSVTTLAASGIDGHTHGVTKIKASATDGSDDGLHNHLVTARVIFPFGGEPRRPEKLGICIQHGSEITESAGPVTGFGFRRTLTNDDQPRGDAGGISDANLGGVSMVVSRGAHHHSLNGITDSVRELGPGTHTHPVTVQIEHASVGATGLSARSGVRQLDYFTGLAIKIWRGNEVPVDYTKKILDQLHKTNPSVWSPGGTPTASLDGGKGMPLTDSGTGPIRLDLIDGLTFEPDEFVPYEVELSVPGEGNGGCIQYNLYVE